VSRLGSAFAQLSEIQRKTLTMYYFEEMDLREISARLSVPLGNIRHHFYRGMERLRRCAFADAPRTNGNG
jgi:RNA polymerase sigma-70 factor (ECF subfamily)